MSTLVAKKTFSIKKEIASELDLHKNKSKFVNEALGFYISYLHNIEQYKEKLLEHHIQEALVGESYKINLTPPQASNTEVFTEHSQELENNILSAIKE